METRGEENETITHVCGDGNNGVAIRVLSPVMGRMKLASATRGKNGPAPSNVISTEALADGMPRKQWDKQRRLKVRDARVSDILDKM